ncbi:nuclear transport factor 2 family protein [Sphingomonas sp. 2R-10]|uniref:nuclear transport factor 2 family protein n=1 Tax=Sphingomonas sp. 2R-10 TaxID=3045148 RepID=UPI0019D11178|nr:nuclear transport factor 2 family protein [Sphingomonas sp. 2R-10]
MTRLGLLGAVALSMLPLQPLLAQQTPAPPTETIRTAATHTPTEQQIIDLSKTKWVWMADRKVDPLAALFDDRAMFTHMGGTWGKAVELATIQSGGIWYKKASIHAVDVRVFGDDRAGRPRSGSRGRRSHRHQSLHGHGNLQPAGRQMAPDPAHLLAPRPSGEGKRRQQLI